MTEPRIFYTVDAQRRIVLGDITEPGEHYRVTQATGGRIGLVRIPSMSMTTTAPGGEPQTTTLDRESMQGVRKVDGRKRLSLGDAAEPGSIYYAAVREKGIILVRVRLLDVSRMSDEALAAAEPYIL